MVEPPPPLTGISNLKTLISKTILEIRDWNLEISNMLDNHVYNLMRQMVEEHTSLWRISNEYKKDAADCADCKAFWDKLEKDKNDHGRELEELLKKHLG